MDQVTALNFLEVEMSENCNDFIGKLLALQMKF
jgi:hypothetical protein